MLKLLGLVVGTALCVEGQYNMFDPEPQCRVDREVCGQGIHTTYEERATFAVYNLLRQNRTAFINLYGSDISCVPRPQDLVDNGESLFPLEWDTDLSQASKFQSHMLSTPGCHFESNTCTKFASQFPGEARGQTVRVNSYGGSPLTHESFVSATSPENAIGNYLASVSQCQNIFYSQTRRMGIGVGQNLRTDETDSFYTATVNSKAYQHKNPIKSGSYFRSLFDYPVPSGAAHFAASFIDVDSSLNLTRMSVVIDGTAHTMTEAYGTANNKAFIANPSLVQIEQYCYNYYFEAVTDDAQTFRFPEQTNMLMTGYSGCQGQLTASVSDDFTCIGVCPYDFEEKRQPALVGTAVMYSFMMVGLLVLLVVIFLGILLKDFKFKKYRYTVDALHFMACLCALVSFGCLAGVRNFEDHWKPWVSFWMIFAVSVYLLIVLIFHGFWILLRSCFDCFPLFVTKRLFPFIVFLFDILFCFSTGIAAIILVSVDYNGEDPNLYLTSTVLAFCAWVFLYFAIPGLAFMRRSEDGKGLAVSKSTLV